MGKSLPSESVANRVKTNRRTKKDTTGENSFKTQGKRKANAKKIAPEQH